MNTAYSIPAKPEGEINPAELVVADALLETMNADLVPADKHATLYERIRKGFPALCEEAWHRLFGHTEPERKTAKVVPISAYHLYYEPEQS